MRAWLVVVCLLAVACDSRARASDPAARGQKSKEYETCSSTVDCQEDLRCFDHECRRTARSTVGDYFAAVGARLRAKGDLEGAIDAYNRALGHYDSEKVALPPDVDCAYGSVLAAARSSKDHAELGARVLHRCLLALPVGSPLRARALADLALLADAGLDPLTLGRTSLADIYLTRAPAAPSLDKLVVDVKANPQPGGKTYHEVPDRLGAPDMRPALVNCWQAYNKATHKPAMAVSIPVKSRYIPSEYDDEPGSFRLKVEAAAGLPPGPEASADACVRAAVTPVLEDLKTVRESFTTRLTITIK